MPKKYFLFIFLLFLAMGLSACGGNDAGVPGKDFTVTIIQPERAEYAIGRAIKFEGSATDHYYKDGEWYEIEITGSDLIWESSLDGQIGVGEEFSRSNLSLGEHIITLTAIGYNDVTESASAVISIIEIIYQDPEPIIMKPGSSKFNFGEKIDFEGYGLYYYYDGEWRIDPIKGNNLVWVSSLDNQIGTGEKFSRSDLSLGDHIITLTAIGVNDATESTSISITISPDPNQSLDPNQ